MEADAHHLYSDLETDLAWGEKEEVLVKLGIH